MWSLGCVLYEILHGEALFTGKLFEIYEAIKSCQLKEFKTKCPSKFKKIIMKCLEKDADERPTALEFLDCVESIKYS